jgi:PLD-like domain
MLTSASDRINVITVYFDHLPERMANFIVGAGVIRGCIAWLTHPLVLKALANVPDVQLVVQKEDFLRPDPGGFVTARELRSAYESLGRKHRPAVRWKGPVPDRELPEWPKMHHKFLVRVDVHAPEAVWTGSFNPAIGSTPGDDNAVVIRDAAIAMQFYNEWERVWMMSEEIVWK